MPPRGIARCFHATRAPTQILLQRVIAEIPTKGDFPAVARVIEICAPRPGASTAPPLDVARIVLRDTGFASKLLRLVNSAFYRRQGEPVSTVTRAVMMVGFEAIRDLASVILVVEELLRAGKANPYVRDGLRSALYRGLCRNGCRRTSAIPKPEEAYLLGLFGDSERSGSRRTTPPTSRAPLARAAARAFRSTPAYERCSAGSRRRCRPRSSRPGDSRRRSPHIFGPAVRRRAALDTAGARLSAIVQLANDWSAGDRGRPRHRPPSSRAREALFGSRPSSSSSSRARHTSCCASRSPRSVSAA